jgi:hypothetical protein
MVNLQTKVFAYIGQVLLVNAGAAISVVKIVAIMTSFGRYES